MSMVKCPECKCEISAEAEICPGCGHRMKDERYYTLKKGEEKGSFALIFFALLALIIFIGGCSISYNASTVEIPSRYSFSAPTKETDWGSFFTVLVPYVFYSVALIAIGVTINRVKLIYDILSGLYLEKEKDETEKTIRMHIGQTEDTWRCKKCGAWNPTGRATCRNCGEFK